MPDLRPSWAITADIGARELNPDQLLYVAGLARGLRGTLTNRSAKECRDLGETMVSLLAHIAHLEQPHGE